MRIQAQIRKAKASAGFTLAEVLVATGLSGFAVTSLMATFASGFSLLETTRQELRATQILQERMEMIRLVNWDQLNTPGFVPTSFSAYYNATNRSGFTYYGTVTVTNAGFGETYNPTLRKVTVALTWTNGPAACNRQVTSLVSRYGMQNYVY